MARHSPTPKPWAPAEDEYLLGALSAGKTHGEIAEALDRPRSSINSRLATLANKGCGLPVTPPPKAKCRRLPAMPAGPRTSTHPRQCMCCGTTFPSQGPHNRLCSKCRLKAGDFSPLHP